MPAFLTSASLRTALGNDLTTQIDALKQPPAAPPDIQCDVLQAPTTLPYLSLPADNKPASTAAERFYAQLDAAVTEALAHAELSTTEKSRTAVLLGSSSLDICISEQQYQDELEHSDTAIAMRSHCMGGIADYLADKFGLSAATYTFNTACTSAANALLYASNMITAGVIDNALVVATEFFNHTTALGFHSLELFCKDGMRPFEDERSGLVLGEACGAAVLSKLDRSGRSQIIAGGANVCDRYGISSANPDGSSIAHVMRQALEMTNLEPGDIRAIKAHGTASLSNDEAEAAGMHAVFPCLPPITAMKPYIGHTLGACGLAETILFCTALRAGFVVAAPGIAATPGKLNITLQQDAGTTTELSGHYMLNFFGFGGNNTSLVIAHAMEQG